jgi:hypothetical protein
MQIRKKWLNQVKTFFNKHFKEHYLASFCWLIPSSCENHCNLIRTLMFGPPGSVRGTEPEPDPSIIKQK